MTYKNNTKQYKNNTKMYKKLKLFFSIFYEETNKNKKQII